MAVSWVIENKDDLKRLQDRIVFGWLHGETPVFEEHDKSTGKWGMARIWRKWMAQTAEFMSANGVTMPLMFKKDGEPWGSRAFNAEDAHELFCCQWLGVDKDGLRLSWSKKGRDGMRPATKAERFLAMQKHEAWAVERGINLFNPRDENEYAEMKKAQES